jgi:hypothetical protein
MSGLSSLARTMHDTPSNKYYGFTRGGTKFHEVAQMTFTLIRGARRLEDQQLGLDRRGAGAGAIGDPAGIPRSRQR